MMMLRVQNNTSATITLANSGILAGGFKLFPADRCTWNFTYDSNSKQYEIDVAEFYPGDTNAVSLNGTNRVVTLGYIGKSGRFIEISE